MNLDSMKNLNRNDFLGLFGLETRRASNSYVLPALTLFGVGLLVGTGLGLLAAQRTGKELRASISDTLQGAPRAITRLPGRVSAAMHRAVDHEDRVELPLSDGEAH